MTNISIWEKIAGTPWWTYLFICYVVYTQYLALKPRTVAIRKTMLSFLLLVIFALILIAWQLNSNINLMQAQTIAYLISIILSGITLGFLQCKLARIAILVDSKQIYIPGSILNVLISLMSFILLGQVIQYYGLAWLMKPIVILLWSGLLIGMILGRLIALSLAIKVAQLSPSRAPTSA